MIFDITQISQGMPGVGGTGVINSGNFEVLVDNVVLGSGLIGNNTLENHSGGGVFKVIGTGNFGYGGDGSDGMLFGPESGMSVDGFVGGGGGGGGYASARIKNDTNDIVTVTVVVAAGGAGGMAIPSDWDGGTVGGADWDGDPGGNGAVLFTRVS